MNDEEVQHSRPAEDDSATEASTSAAAKARKPKDYFSRREQYRLLTLVFTLLLVIFMMFEAAKPANWQWMWQMGEVAPATHQSEDADIDTRLLPQAVEPIPADVFLARADADSTTESSVVSSDLLLGVAELDLEQLRDDTVFRGVESPVWYGLLGLLNQLDLDSIEKKSMGMVGFTQLFRQTDQYRGRTVTVAGTVRRAFKLEAGKNESGIESYWQCWLQPDGNTNPIVVYSLEMPIEFPEGLAVRERAEFTGIYYKRWAYAAKEGTRTAPLVLAKVPRWTKATPPVIPPAARPSDMFLVGLCALLVALGLTFTVYVRTKPRQRVEVSDSLKVVIVFLCMLLWQPTQLGAQEDLGEKPTVADVRSFLGMFEIGDEQLALAAKVGSNDAALRLLDRLRRCPDRFMQEKAYALNDAGSFTRLAVADAVRIRAQLNKVERVEVLSEIGSRIEPNVYYRCQCSLQSNDEPPQSIIILTRKIPQRWESELDNFPFDEKVTCTALALSMASVEQPEPVFATERIAWHPAVPIESLQVAADHVLLASHGMDIGELDEVKPKGQLSPHDRAAFYQMLLAIGRVPSGELHDAARSVNVTDLLQNTDSHSGKLYEISGTLRRCVKILVDDEQARRYGLSSYYELVIFLDPNARVKIRSKEEEEGKYFATYPVVVCVRSIPEGFPEGEEVLAATRVIGSYLKLWAYPSAFMEADGGKSLQFSPLLIGSSPKIVSASQTSDPLGGTGVAVGFGTILLLLTGLVWFWSRGDAKFKRNTLSRKYELPSGTSLDDSSFEEAGEPRFDE